MNTKGRRSHSTHLSTLNNTLSISLCLALFSVTASQPSLWALSSLSTLYSLLSESYIAPNPLHSCALLSLTTNPHLNRKEKEAQLSLPSLFHLFTSLPLRFIITSFFSLFSSLPFLTSRWIQQCQAWLLGLGPIVGWTSSGPGLPFGLGSLQLGWIPTVSPTCTR